MSGHSQFKNIMHRKNAQDNKRAKLFIKLSKEFQVAVQKGGADPSNNPALRLIISKAQVNNMPKSNYLKIIDKYKNSKNSDQINEYKFEGYLPNHITVIIECLSDNHNRITSEIKSYFNKANGSLVKSNALNHLFQQIGLFEFKVTDFSHFNEETLLYELLAFNILDMQTSHGIVIIKTDFSAFGTVHNYLEPKVSKFITLETRYESLDAKITLPEDKIKLYNKFFSTLEVNPDVKTYYSNLANELVLSD